MIQNLLFARRGETVNRMPVLALLFLLILAFSSCVPNKKLTYLQYKDDLKGDTPKDTITRIYELKKSPYRLKEEDIISIRVASITDSQYDFIQKYSMDLGTIRKLGQYSQGKGGDVDVGSRINLGGGLQGAGDISRSIASDRPNIGFTIDLNGELELPQIGKLKLAGLTIPEAEMMVRDSLQGYFEVPMVRIQLLNYHFTIMGEVESEGRYTSFDPEITLFDAILMAGNLTEFADRANLKIVRQIDDTAEIFYINMLDESSLEAKRFFLHRDDLIIVPALPARTTQRYTLNNLSRTLGIIGTVLSLTAIILTLRNR